MHFGQNEDTGVLYTGNTLHEILTTDHYDDDDLTVIGGATEAVSILADYLKLPTQVVQYSCSSDFMDSVYHSILIQLHQLVGFRLVNIPTPCVSNKQYSVEKVLAVHTLRST